MFWSALVNAGAISGSETILQDISFSVAPGESLALLGRNGAGKSTLLKILTRATPATSGSVMNNGRTTALIELGLGMNAELTGRENALMGCQIQDLNDPLEQLVEEISHEGVQDTKYQAVPGWEVLYLLPVLAVQYAFVLGVGLIFGILNAFMRDFGHSLAIVLHFWFWLTPIVYPVEILPDWARLVIERFNPMTPVIEGYHVIFVYHGSPDLWAMLPTAILALALVGIGLWMFRRTSGALGDLA